MYYRQKPYDHPMDSAKAFNKIQHLFMLKIVRKLVIRGKYLNPIKVTDDQSMANIILKGKNWKHL